MHVKRNLLIIREYHLLINHNDVFREILVQKPTLSRVHIAYMYRLFNTFMNIRTLCRNDLLYYHYFQYVYLSTVKVRTLIMGQKFRGTVFIQTISSGTTQKREQQQQQQQRVSAYSSVHLLGVRNGICWTLYVFPMRSCALLCVPMCSLCIRIVLCWKIFINCVRYCAFTVALDQPLLYILQYRALSVLYHQINLSQTLAIAKNWHLNDLLFLL